MKVENDKINFARARQFNNEIGEKGTNYDLEATSFNSAQPHARSNFRTTL